MSYVCVLRVPQLFILSCHKVCSCSLKLGNYSAENQLLKYSAKDYYFKAVICHFALMGAERASVSEAHLHTHHTHHT